MKTSQNTILITGGSAGIGFEIAKQLSAKNNHVIIIGRNQERLDKAAAQLQNVTAIKADVSNVAEIDALVSRLQNDFPQLNVVINNAGAVQLNNLISGDIFEKAQAEMFTNYLSIVRLNEKLLPSLQQQPEAAIVNVSSIVAFAPSISLATYAATKAALHTYTRALRLALRNTTVKVFELMPPLVNTEFSAEIGGAERGIPASQVADEFIASLESDNYEIRVAGTEQFYRLYLSDPEAALKAINSIE
ncbi:SDR family oxidoreductase [Mucilaginibacter celer]|uniref:SDR family NAD(P)-dependent oxidoreductase n=1 Tax=Mucilaginibacter celer TaxID=2305508 RepID=A0A494W0V9_9SPHI|nr:SDR family NAD(P)-dependent oxidoreductase [Mucilaginibacter celer]AYL96912.1 SDR family NAD(P)-dependent oxidoreductase [Mucilaginibacter celer]